MNWQILLIILAMTAVTYGARVIPFILFRGKKLSPGVEAFIKAVPVALLAALVIPELIVSPDNTLDLFNPYLLTGICTFLFARFVPNLFLTVLFGMFVFWGFDKLI